MTIDRSAYIVALEKKLYEAERALDGFRAIFNHFREVEGTVGEWESEGFVLRSVQESAGESGTCYLTEPPCEE